MTCVVALLIPAARASGASLETGFEDGLGAWQAAGLWHVQADPESVGVSPDIGGLLSDVPAGATLPPAFAGTHAAWFGDPGTGTYCHGFADVRQHPSNGCTSDGVVAGTLTSPALSLGDGPVGVRFEAWWEISGGSPDVTDLMMVEYSTDDGATWTEAGRLNPDAPPWGSRHQIWSLAGHKASGDWRAYSFDLSAAAGQDGVRLRFRFDSVDPYGQGFRGLLVDDVVIDGITATADPPPTVTQLIAGVRLGPSASGRPERGRSIVLEPTGGRSAYTLPGGRDATPLTRRTLVPVGTIVDTRAGSVKLTSASDDAGGTQTGTFNDGVFKVLQQPGETMVDLVLRGGTFPHCDNDLCDAGAARRVVRSSSVRRIRRLWGNAHGLFRTRGRYACATIRGTNWLVEDRANGTFVRVRRGVVVVTDHGLKRDVVVRAGETYFARALHVNKQQTNPRFQRRYAIAPRRDGRTVHVYQKDRVVVQTRPAKTQLR